MNCVACTHSVWPSWICLCCSARISVSFELHWVIKCSTRSPAPLENIPVEAEDRPSVCTNEATQTESQSWKTSILLKCTCCIKYFKNHFVMSYNLLYAGSIPTVLHLPCLPPLLTSAPAAIASADQPCNGTNSSAAFRIRAWSCSSVSYSSSCSPSWSW